MKKLTALFGSCLFFFIVMSMYLVLDQFNSNIDKDHFIRETQNAVKSVEEIRVEVEKLKKGLDFSNRAIDTMNDKVEDVIPKNEEEDKTIHDENKQILFEGDSDDTGAVGEEMCEFTSQRIQKQDLKILDVFDKVPFDNKDGGSWKQGWNVVYNENSFAKKKLLVFVVPHSHNDPGWLKTVDQYFHEQTIKIISNVVDALAKNENRKFIWAETSYFAMWWQKADPAKKQLAQEQINNGQLEIVTGGWVMNDEANPHYFNMLDQLVEGHQWMENHLGVKPKYGWSIDPFGYSPTMAYLLKRMGFNGMLIQRVHYSLKKYLAENKYLEFMWRQTWDHGSSTDMFTHLMPFYSYDVPHTCGPDPKICCQFDFRRLPGGGMFCPWHVPPREINSANVKERSELLLDQYKKKAQLYQSNVVLAPLGDDFRYDKEFETKAQFENYERIMDYINSQPELNTEIKFGTLKDYFEAVAKRGNVSPGEQPFGFPSFGGDFFTYADRDDHYWSGYYTSRSFYKHMDRELVAHLRGAEILYTLALAHSKHHGKFPADSLYPKLIASRKELALFQHHDGITGTSKDHVVIDYGQRMLRALTDSIKIMEVSSEYLLTEKKENIQESNAPVMKFLESRSGHDAMPVKDVVIVSDTPKYVVFYNSLSQRRQQTVYVYISEPFIQVMDVNGNIVPHQVSLIWKSELVAFQNKYELSFCTTIPALGFVRYQIIRVSMKIDNSLATTKTYNAVVRRSDEQFSVERGKDKQIIVENKYLMGKFDSDTGMLTDLKLNGKEHKVQIRFMKYGTVGHMDRSGAYLFLPNGNAVSVAVNNPPVTVTSGNIYTEIQTRLEYVTHKVKIYHTDTDEAHSLDIQNIVDIRSTSNFELVMRIESDLKNENKEFFTDLNGFQMQRRRTYGKLPLQANFYPAPTMIYIQDGNSRLSIQTQQANGVASLEQGYLEIVLDRRLMQDDNRGLGQGVTDNKVTPTNFKLLLEDFEAPMEKDVSLISYPSIRSITLSHQLQHPIFLFSINTVDVRHLLPYSAGLKKPLPCDLHIVNLKALQDNIKLTSNGISALFIHRIGYDCRFKSKCSERRLTFQEVFEPITVKDVEEMSLSLMHSKKQLDGSDRITVSPMEINAYKLRLT